MTALSPGQSPPPVSTPTRMKMSLRCGCLVGATLVVIQVTQGWAGPRNYGEQPDSRLLRVVEPSLDGVADELHAVVQLQLAEGVLDMVLDRAVGDDQAFRDLLVAQALRHQPQRLRLPVGELRRPRLVGVRRGRGL